MTYWVCEANSRERLQRDVQDLIDKGWRPLGGLAVVHSHSTSDWWYFQAMVLHGEDEGDELA
jgi:hypothetical protein